MLGLWLLYIRSVLHSTPVDQRFLCYNHADSPYQHHTYSTSRASVRIPVPTFSYFLRNSTRQYSILKLPHQLVRLLRQTQGQYLALSVSRFTHLSSPMVPSYCVRQYPCQMCEITFVYREQALRLDRLIQAIENTRVQITGLVVHPRHYGICRDSCLAPHIPYVHISCRLTWRVHNATDYKATGRTTCQMQGWAFLHAQMSHQSPLREEIRRQLHRASEARSHHSRADASIQPLDTFFMIDLPHSVHRIFVLMLRANRQERGIGL